MPPVEEILKENDQLKKIIQNQTLENQNLQQEVTLLHERVRLLLAQKYGRSSEQLSQDQLHLFGDTATPEAPAPEAEIPVGGHNRKKPGRRTLPKHLERVCIEYDLTDEEKLCSCGCGPMQRIGEETSEQLDIIPAKVQIIEHVRLKYACKSCNQGIKISPKPLQPIPKSNATANTLAYIMVSKYEDALPLYRQEKMLSRVGVEIPRGTLANWMIGSGSLTQPLVNLLWDNLLEGPVIGMDETPVQVLKEPDRKAETKSYMWCGRGGPPGKECILYDYSPTRKQEVPKELLTGYRGYLQTDGHKTYIGISSQEGIRSVGCMAHARRKFMDAIKAQGKNRKPGKADDAIKWIKELYKIESEGKELTPDKRKILRQEQAKPLLDDVRIWLDKTLVQVPPKSKTGEALHYMNNQWERLLIYLKDGHIPIDNNAVERAIRPVVLGRKNWLFCNSVKGAYASANLYSLIETAKCHGWEPYEYLKIILTELPKADTAEKFEALLPWNLPK